MGKRWLWCAVVGLVGCSSSSGSTSSDGGADNAAAGMVGAGTGGSAGSMTSGGASTSGGANGGVADAGSANGGSADAGTTGAFVSTLVSVPSIPRGYLNAAQITTDQVTFSYDVNVEFSTSRAQWDGCTRNQLGSCWYYDCPAGSVPVGQSGGENPLQDAGVVTVNSGSGPITIPGISSNAYQYTLQGSSQLWPLTGGMLTFSVAGSAAVPALSMDVALPPGVWLTSVNGETAPTVITRSDRLKLAWTSLGTGTAFFALFAYTGEHPAALCQFDAAANAGELPAAVLEKVDAGATYYIQLRGDSRAHLEMNGWVSDAGVDAEEGPGYDLKVSLM